ncbi:MAG: recombinase RecA [Polyangiaceae bacterium]|nr:recombinase RecA [Polyangiaceae bacterium]
MSRIEEKLQSIRALVGGIEKAFGKGAVMQLGDEGPNSDVAVFRSGSRALDEALGIGGYPRGRIIEVFGPESSGKTTLTLHAIAQAQAAGGVAAFIDAEHALDVAYARALGVDTEKLLVSQPDNGEQALEIVDMLTRSEIVDLIVIDSVAALTPKAEIEGDMGDQHMGLQARLMSQALRKLTATAHRTGTALMFINQLRQKIGVVFGSPETTTGGNALKFYASVRIDVRKTGQLKVGDEVIGSKTRAKVVKNKMARPFREAEFEIRWGSGIDSPSDLLDCGVRAGVVTKAGAFYSFGNENIGQGREKCRETLLARDELRLAIADAIDVSHAAGIPAKTNGKTSANAVEVAA